jgi:hypothetical protein
MRVFIRYARQSSVLQNVVFGVPWSSRTGWTINSGVNVSVFLTMRIPQQLFVALHDGRGIGGSRAGCG